MFLQSAISESRRLATAVAITAVALIGCDEAPAPESIVPPSSEMATAESAAAAPAPRAQSAYVPVGPEAEALGLLTVSWAADGSSSGRTFSFAQGKVIETELVGTADITKSIGEGPMSVALGITDDVLKNGGDPRTYLMKVNSETPSVDGKRLCGDGSSTFLISRQLDTEADRSLTLAFLSAAPGEANSEVCMKVVYTAR